MEKAVALWKQKIRLPALTRQIETRSILHHLSTAAMSHSSGQKPSFVENIRSFVESLNLYVAVPYIRPPFNGTLY